MTAVEPKTLGTAPHHPSALVWTVPTRQRALAQHSWRGHVKRALDVVLVVLMAPIAIPLLLVIAVVVKLVSGGPVLFRQGRIGRGGALFTMLKFRTMYADATERLRADPDLCARYIANDYKLPVAEDPRIVPLGRFLRRTSLDELPQLWNVLRGHMSLVGPRPVVPSELRLYGDLAGAYLEVRPGLTGSWQTDGRNDIRYPERARIDAEYIEDWTLTRDVVIMLKTIPCVLRRQGSQ